MKKIFIPSDSLAGIRMISPQPLRQRDKNSKYEPHQGKKEIEKAKKKLEKQNASN